MYISTLLILAALLSVAAISDLRCHRVPNWVSLGGLLVAVFLQGVEAGPSGVLFAMSGVAVGFAVLVVPHALSMMGAGDVKLMMMSGAFLGWQAALEASLATLIIGGVMGVFLVAVRGGLIPLLRRYGTMLLALAAQHPAYLSPPEGDAARTRFPYALAIALGTMIAVYRAHFA